MPFRPPNQQRQNTEGTRTNRSFFKTLFSYYYCQKGRSATAQAQLVKE